MAPTVNSDDNSNCNNGNDDSIKVVGRTSCWLGNSFYKYSIIAEQGANVTILRIHVYSWAKINNQSALYSFIRHLFFFSRRITSFNLGFQSFKSKSSLIFQPKKSLLLKQYVP